MRKTLIVAALVAGIAAPLAAQNAAAPAATPAARPAQPAVGNTPEDRARGGIIFRTFSVAINSDKVPLPVKNQLISCLYNNPMRNLSVSAGQVFAKNKSLDAKNPQQVYAVASQLCGVRPQTAAAPAAGAAPARPVPTPSPSPTAGR
jgi:hypothetical protein